MTPAKPSSIEEMANEYAVSPLPKDLFEKLKEHKPDNLKIIQEMQRAAYLAGAQANAHLSAKNKVADIQNSNMEYEAEIAQIKAENERLIEALQQIANQRPHADCALEMKNIAKKALGIE